MKTGRSESGVAAIVQARLSSMRFPRKVLLDLDGLPLVEFMIERVKAAETVHEIILAVPEEELDSPLADIAARQSVSIRGGSNSDVLSRFASVVRNQPQETVVRLTADCPLVDPEVIDALVLKFQDSDFDYLRTGKTYPDGLDVEVTTRRLLLLANREVSDPLQREHVTQWIAGDSRMRQARVEHSSDLGQLRLTVDEPEDAEVVRAVVASLPRASRGLSSIEALWLQRPELFIANAHLTRDYGATQTNEMKLWRRAKRVMPGGGSLLSKRPEMHLPNRWPTYFVEARGCRVTSLEGREFIDAGLMGVGTSILGFGDARVDEAVARVVRMGVVSTLNCTEEVLLAERLVELHPWARGVRFTRSGGEACAVAVRIGRAASGKDKVAICGYHGWHDWYLAANLTEGQALDSHLLPGLSTRGVPRVLAGTTLPFAYNDLEGLRKILEGGDVGVIVMEVERSSPPVPGFLEGVRALATAFGAVLVFDESTSAFRKVLGGHHLTFGIDPDIAVFGKTLGNGYAIAAVVGKESVMSVAEELFISSTFWSERLGPAAALAAISAMQEDDAPSQIDALGTQFRIQLARGLGSNQHRIRFAGLPALTSISVPDEGNDRLLKTFITQSLLERGYLGGTAFYAAMPHDEVLDDFTAVLSDVLNRYFLEGSDGVQGELKDQPLVGAPFGRLA